MGLYSIPCRQCEKMFLWFSGSLDQRCADCKKLDTIQWDTGDKNFGANIVVSTILTTTHNQADPNWMGLTEEDDKK